MRNLLLFLLVWNAFISCSVNNENKKETKKIKDFYVHANFIDDSTIDGMADFYDQDKILIERRNYNKGLRHGISQIYYPSGIIREKTFFKNDIRSGYNYLYDTSGQLEYVDHFIEGKVIGPIIYYESGKIKDYYFVDFEGNTLFYAEYDSLGKVVKTDGDLIHITVTNVLTDSAKMLKLFIYTPNPPELKLSFSLGLIDSSRKIFGQLISLDTGNVYVEKILPYPPQGKNYCIFLNFFDHVREKETVAIRRII